MANWTTTGYELFNATALPATAEFTIIPESGYSISAIQFQYTQTLDYIVDITFSDNGNAGTPTNTVKGTIQFAGSDDYTFNSDIQQSIVLNVAEEEQINSITLSTAVTVQSYGNNAAMTGANVNISSGSSYTGYETLISPNNSWNIEIVNDNTTYVAFPFVNVPLDSHVNFMEITITPDQGHYFADSPHEDANGNEIFALEDSSLTLNLPGFGNGTQSYQAEEYINEQAWEISRELIMEPVNGETQSTSEPVMVCTSIKFVINYFSPATSLLLDLNNNNTFDEEFLINISIPGVVPRVLYFLDQGPLHVGYSQLSGFQLPIKNTTTSYTFTESGNNTEIFDPNPEAFANFVSLNLAQNTVNTEKSAGLGITANSATVNNSPSVTSSSIQIIQNPGPFINAYGKFSSQDESSYSQGVEVVSSFGDTITLKVETNLPDSDEFTAAEALLDVFILNGDGTYTTVNNGQQISGASLFSDAEVEAITTEIQNGFNIAQQSNNVATVQISIPENTDSALKVISIVFNHPLDSSITSSVSILQAAGYSSSVNTFEFYAATSYNSNNVPIVFQDLGSNAPTAVTDNNYISNDGGIIELYALVPDIDLEEYDLQNLIVLNNNNLIEPGLGNYYLSDDSLGYQHFNNLQVEYFSYDSSIMTGGPVNIKITFNAPQNDFIDGNNINDYNFQQGTPSPSSVDILGYNPLNPYFSPNNTGNNSPDDIAVFKQAQLDYIDLQNNPANATITLGGGVSEITSDVELSYFDSLTGQAKVEILQYKNIIIDPDTGSETLSDWINVSEGGAPGWIGFDENTTTTSSTSPTSSSAFLPSLFSPTVYHQPISSSIGREVKLGFTTGSTNFDDNNFDVGPVSFSTSNKQTLTINFSPIQDYLEIFGFRLNASYGSFFNRTYSDHSFNLDSPASNGHVFQSAVGSLYNFPQDQGFPKLNNCWQVKYKKIYEYAQNNTSQSIFQTTLNDSDLIFPLPVGLTHDQDVIDLYNPTLAFFENYQLPILPLTTFADGGPHTNNNQWTGAGAIQPVGDVGERIEIDIKVPYSPEDCQIYGYAVQEAIPNSTGGYSWEWGDYAIVQTNSVGAVTGGESYAPLQPLQLQINTYGQYVDSSSAIPFIAKIEIQNPVTMFNFVDALLPGPHPTTTEDGQFLMKLVVTINKTKLAQIISTNGIHPSRLSVMISRQDYDGSDTNQLEYPSLVDSIQIKFGLN